MLGSIDEHLVIHIGGVVLGTANKVLPFLAVNEATEGLTYLGLVQLPGDLGLYLHDLGGTALLDLFGDIILQFIGRCVFLMAIGEAPQALETHLAYKLLEKFKILLCLVRIAYNQGGTNGYFGHRLAEVLQ